MLTGSNVQFEQADRNELESNLFSNPIITIHFGNKPIIHQEINKLFFTPRLLVPVLEIALKHQNRIKTGHAINQKSKIVNKITV